MNLTFTHIDGVNQIKMLSSNATYGIGFLTSIAFGFCNIFGLECKMYDKKIEKAKNQAVSKLMDKATAAGATGIMDIKFQMHATTVFAYGIAYTNK